MLVERVDLDLGRRSRRRQPRVVVVRREHGGRRARLVPQRDGEQRGRRRPPREVHAVQVRHRAQDGRLLVAVHGEVLHELAVRERVGDRQRARVVAQERHVGHDRGEPVGQPADREREPAALADPRDGHPRGVDPGQRPHGVDRTDGVRDEPPVVVLVRVEDPARHHAGRRRPGARRVGRVAAGAPGGALPARVHHQVHVPGGGPGEPLVREPAPAAVPDELDDRGQVPGRPRGPGHPGLDRVPAEPGERHVERVDDREPGVDRRHGQRRGRTCAPRRAWWPRTRRSPPARPARAGSARARAGEGRTGPSCSFATDSVSRERLAREEPQQVVPRQHPDGRPVVDHHERVRLLQGRPRRLARSPPSRSAAAARTCAGPPGRTAPRRPRTPRRAARAR